MDALRDLSIIWTLIHCCAMFMLLYESRFPKRKTNIITAVFVVPLMLLNLVNVWIFGTVTAGKLIVPCCVLPSLIFFFIMAKNRDTRFIFTFCLSDTIVLEITFASNIIDKLCNSENHLIMFIIRFAAYPILELLIIKYVRKPYHYLQENTRRGWGVFSLLAALFYVIILVFTFYPTVILDRMEYVPHLALILILVPVMYLTIFNVLWKQLELLKSEEQNRMLALQNKMAEERLKSVSEREESLNLLRHDMKHKMIILDGYLKSGKTSEAEEYIKNISSNIDENKIKIYCDNHTVNAVLSYYGKIAEDKGIKLETDINLSGKLNIEETDLAVILSNGVENAINALESCPEKTVMIKAFAEDQKLFLEIKNAFSGKIAFEGNLPKSARENHGYGTKSMAATVEKYGGIYSFEIENGQLVFRCSV